MNVCGTGQGAAAAAAMSWCTGAGTGAVQAGRPVEAGMCMCHSSGQVMPAHHGAAAAAAAATASAAAASAAIRQPAGSPHLLGDGVARALAEPDRGQRLLVAQRLLAEGTVLVVAAGACGSPGRAGGCVAALAPCRLMPAACAAGVVRLLAARRSPATRCASAWNWWPLASPTHLAGPWPPSLGSPGLAGRCRS